MNATANRPTLTIDVSAEAPATLRSRLRGEPGLPASVLPGGLTLEETEEGPTYRLDRPGEWTLSEANGAITIRHEAGHALRLADGRLSLTLLA